MHNTLGERAHRYLDGDLPRNALTHQELLEVQAYESVLGELRALDRSMRSPDLSGHVMSRLGERAKPRGVWAWLWAPRPVRLRPVYGMAAAVVLVLAASLGGDDPPPGAGTVESGTILVQFRIDAPSASSVHLAGSFTDWQPAYALHQTGSGVWSAVVPLEPGVHDYAFVVDGNWTHDPIAPAVADGFGGVNSRLLVVLSEEAPQI